MTLYHIRRLFAALFCVSALLLGATCSASAEQNYIAKFAFTTPLDGNGPGIAAQRLAKEVFAKSKGRLQIKLFPNEQLGGEPQVVQGVKTGTVEMAWMSAGVLGAIYPDLQILNGPYLFPDWPTAQRVLTGPVGQSIYDGLLKATGIRALDPLWLWGWRDFTANKPIRIPADMVGLKTRSINSPIFISMIKALGASPQALSISEIYGALQSRVIDSQENSLDLFYQRKWYEVNRYASLSRHILQSNAVIINDAFYQSLPQDLQEILVTETRQAGQLCASEQLKAEQDAITQLKAKGVTVIEDVDREAFRKATLKVYDEFKNTWSPALYERIEAAAGQH
jgi:tripartite ATP-independent transporter DctP family solute receptor